MEKLATILWQGSLVSLVIFALLFGADQMFPQMFATRIAWWLLPLLFGVHVLPRLIALGVGALLPHRRHRRT
jgi:hypothetical protein